MRGIPHGGHGWHPHVRFIPAHAGNSAASAVVKRRVEVHPRACGEFKSLLDRCIHGDGSSPRMRGIPLDYEQTRAVWRFIPAHAGNSTRPRRAHGIASVHPRACGEFSRSKAGCGPQRGSSPRMRGIHGVTGRATVARRFIPAHAGNSALTLCRLLMQTVHPRACGEFAPVRRCAGFRQRFIPAHAGNSARASCWRRNSAVHPRACGEFC